MSSHESPSAAELLDAAIGERDIRPLSAQIAERYEGSSEKWRRVIYRVLSGHRLSPENAAALGEFFSIPKEALMRQARPERRDTLVAILRRLDRLEDRVRALEQDEPDEAQGP